MKPKLTAYDSKDRPTTDYGRAVGWGWSEKALPRHKGECSHTFVSSWLRTAPRWVIEAEYARREALRKEREAGK